MYEQIASNKFRTVIIMVLFTLMVLLLGYVFGRTTNFGPWGFFLAIIIASGSVFTSYFFSDKIVLSMNNAREADPKEYPHVVNSVEGLSIAAGLPVPKIYIMDDPAPNAFATGRDPKHSVVCVTTGLLEKLNRQEVEGVLAHEMSHIKNYDILIQSISVVLVAVIALLSDWMLRRVRWSRMGGKGNGEGGAAGALFLVVAILLALLVPLIAQLMRFALSRKREFLADASGALLTRYPEGLASALEKITGDTHALKTANKATAHMFIVNPFLDLRGTINDMFNTHPPAAERIRILRSM